MKLDEYNKKRNFRKTPEPKGKISSIQKQLFVIQKHAASHLHYDFRIELEGVLKSWAVPKGPCFDPKIKRLAMHVEDHPIEYGSFEGIIPQGEYGGGTVMLWDRGVWRSLDKNPKKAYKNGHLRMEIFANKLNGRWDLIRFKDEKHWFLIKFNDQFSKSLTDFDITTEKPNSVKTQLSIEEIAEINPDIWSSKKNDKKNPRKKTINSTLNSINLPPSPFPQFIAPQLATLIDKPPEGKEWIHEIKLDGYRIIAYKNRQKIILKSRNDVDWSSKFPNVISALRKLTVDNVVLDGEIVLLDKEGKSNFQLLQNSLNEHEKAPFIYYIFDCLYIHDKDIRSLPLLERKMILTNILNKNIKTIRYSDHIFNNGLTVFSHSCKLALEGIISKRHSSPYIEKRSKNWLKIKCLKRQEFIIGGYIPSHIKSKPFASLMLGVFNNKSELVYCGNVGTGFTEQSLEEIHKKLLSNSINKNPFNSRPPNARLAQWVQPVLVAEIEFTEWTKGGRLRHPSFQGLRQDKSASAVIKEKEQTLTSVLKSQRKALVKLSNPNKILYPEDKISKKDLFDYYEKISAFILPYLINRLLSLVRCPDNYMQCFYQKHCNTTISEALKCKPLFNKKGTKEEQYIYLTDKEGLLSLVQMGALEIHPWGSLITTLEYPDIIVFDLDPAPDVPWKNVVKAAFDIKEHLAAYGLISFVKTTGGKGLHVVIPIKPEYAWDKVKLFTQTFVQFLERSNPNLYISKMTKSKRQGRIFLDYLRNQRGATAISPYSTRARLGAPIATPLHWDELTADFEDTFYNLHTLPKRLTDLKNDPWKNFWQITQSLRLNEFIK